VEKIQERLLTLERRLFDDDFLEQQRTIIPYYLFVYQLEEEYVVTEGVENLLNRSETVGKAVVEVNLFDIFQEVFKDDLEAIDEMMEIEGLAEVLEAVEPTLNDGKSIVEGFNVLAGEAELILLTGIGTAYPFINVSGLLKRLAVSGNSRRIVVFYPGTFNGTQLSLFGRHEATEDEYQIYIIA